MRTRWKVLSQLTFSSSLPQSFSVALMISALYLRISALRLPTVTLSCQHHAYADISLPSHCSTVRDTWYCDAALFGGSVSSVHLVDNNVLLMSLYMMKWLMSRYVCCPAPYSFRKNTSAAFATLSWVLVSLVKASRGELLYPWSSVFQNRHNLLLPVHVRRGNCVTPHQDIEEPASVTWVWEFVFEEYCRWPLDCADITCRYQYSDLGLTVPPTLEGQGRFPPPRLVYLKL